LKGRALSPAFEALAVGSALAAEGMQVVENDFPQGLKLRIYLPIKRRS
jgi:hypothetical protein